jgi:hypothetical protein
MTEAVFPDLPVPAGTGDADLAGFRAAMIQMRAEMGSDVPFFTKSTGTYPPGTAIDPESGVPFDPTVGELGSAWGSASYRVGVYTHPIGGDMADSEVIANAVGWFEEGNIVIDMDPTDYADVEDATEVEWNGYRYEISHVDGSAIDNVEHRKLVFAKRL